MLRTWCAFAGLCAVCLMRDNSFRLAPLDTSLMEGGKGKRNAEALSGTTSSLCSSCRRKRRGEPRARARRTLLAECVHFQGLLRRCAPRAAASGGANRGRGYDGHSLRSVCTFRDYIIAALLVPPSAGRTEGRGTTDTPYGVCALSGTTSPLRGSCHCCAMGRTDIRD